MNAETLIVASDLAALCQVDLKTVHNWDEKGQGPPSFKTPGRHLRFKAGDVAVWLAKLGYPVPERMRPLLAKPGDERLAKDLDELVAVVRQMSSVERGDLLQRARDVVAARTGAAA